MTVTASLDPTQEHGSHSVEPGGDRGKKDARGFLGVGLADLSEADMATTAARRFMMYEIQRLDDELSKSRKIEASYHELCTETATLRERSKKSGAFEVLIFFATTAGAAGLGAAPSFISVAQVADVGWVIAIGAAVLLLGSVLARWLR